MNEIIEELLNVFIDENSSSKFHKIFKEHNCFLSCYDCVKDYSNQFYHDYLNWRLGLDMIHLALDSKNFLCFTAPHWKKFMETHFGNCNSAKPIIVKDKKLLVVHPLWSGAYIDKIKDDNALGDYTPISVFSFVANYNETTENAENDLPAPNKINNSMQLQTRSLQEGEVLQAGVLYILKDGSRKAYPRFNPEFTLEDVVAVVVQ